ncbi:hypothetical protein [Alysiella crassa]|uniref:Uncharacterized protein n=1 Tax=Alysiella crassa TaxID=153491 RepID=A0A376BW48_9NEIS|nr:hypothetical protein [Alysiella crassa]UOP06497.1 hypothetical protein LVJ80_12150 [Alysiella crassa]SSY81028.1 Uncharacterised protein [Alysiella crassa]
MGIHSMLGMAYFSAILHFRQPENHENDVTKSLKNATKSHRSKTYNQHKY